MAVVHLKTDALGGWTNPDGLRVYFGPSEATVTRVGEYKYLTDGGNHVTEVIVALASLPTVASGNQQILSETIIPNGAFIEAVDILVLKETAGANANFNLGLVDQDRATEIDFDGLLAAADVFNGGTDLGMVERYEKDGGAVTTEGGALIGTKITNSGLLVGFADTGDFTAGVLRCKIHWYIPLAADL